MLQRFCIGPVKPRCASWTVNLENTEEIWRCWIDPVKPGCFFWSVNLETIAERAKLARRLHLQKYHDEYCKKSKGDPLPHTVRAALKADSFCFTKMNHHRNNLHHLCHQSYSRPDLHQNQYQLTPYYNWGITHPTHGCFTAILLVHNASNYDIWAC